MKPVLAVGQCWRRTIVVYIQQHQMLTGVITNSMLTGVITNSMLTGVITNSMLTGVITNSSNITSTNEALKQVINK